MLTAAEAHRLHIERAAEDAAAKARLAPVSRGEMLEVAHIILGYELLAFGEPVPGLDVDGILSGWRGEEIADYVRQRRAECGHVQTDKATAAVGLREVAA